MGHTPEPLNTRGRLQAHRAAGALVPLEPTALYTSPLPRALETATIISNTLGIGLCHRDNLKEADVGLLGGLTQEEMRQQYPDFMRIWSQDPSTAVMPKGESILQVQERAWTTIEEVSRRHMEENVALVSHSFTILGLLCKFLGIPLINFLRLRLGEASITLLEIGLDRTTLLRYNDRCHLEGLEEDGQRT